MPLQYLRRLTGRERTESANRHLARFLAFVAGAANAGGFIAVRQYTSHMSGIVAGMADNLALGGLVVVLHGLAAVTAFLMGAFVTTICVRWARARRLESVYALPLIVEAVLLAFFGLTGRVFSGNRALGTVLLLCFTMGVQNAILTKLSNAVIRTTHITGMVTDMGIGLGRLATRRWGDVHESMASDWIRIRLWGSLIAMFFVGGVIGARGFKCVGFLFTLPLAVIPLALAVMPVLDDIRRTKGSRV